MSITYIKGAFQMKNNNKVPTNEEVKQLKKEVKQEYEHFLKNPEEFNQYKSIDELYKALDSND